ncbi:glucose dehydrogenase short protein [Mycena albidolilacea]|uniref:Glucose dehydrogenase short protein n=1 Tax=Mycena albidolilacea TaxID=1033008 RepID=A0AAD7AR47_9AGAR|nr:glucose dehydrogenase short protein [Mycena albidolilacea]
MLLNLSLILTAVVAPSLAKIYEDVADLPSLEYDFVIVGGGAAGNVVANRLTENPKFSVLVLEAGVSNEDVMESIVPFLAGNLLSGPNAYDWNYTTTPQIGLNNRTTPYPRAHILGGCTATNGMVYTRGSAEDYDRYAAVTGDPGWSWDSLLPYFFKNEEWTQPADHHDTQGQFNPSVHSTDGINSVSLSGYHWPIFEHHVLQTTRELPEEFPFNLDFNSGQMLGIGWLQSTIGGGKRSTSATSYLAPKFAQRRNLHVLLHAQVSRLVDAQKTKQGAVIFGGVEFLQGISYCESLFTAKATKEIILSAGSVGTPTILMHSGIGDRKALTALGIPSVLDLPSVGQNATEQPVIGAGWSVNSTQTVDSIRQNATRFNEAYEEWNRTHTGPFVNLGATFGPTHIGWMRLDADSPIFENVTDPAAGPNTPHIEMFLGTGGFAVTGNFINLGMVVLNPTSRGSVTLQSNNPFDPPLIDLGLLKTDFDIFTAREAIKRAYRFVQAPVWRDYIIAPTFDLSNLSTEALDQYIRNGAYPGAHLVSTAAMSARDASYGVVNPDLLVKGASGLSIIDASILPFITSAHTQAAAYVVGERGADLVKERWR